MRTHTHQQLTTYNLERFQTIHAINAMQVLNAILAMLAILVVNALATHATHVDKAHATNHATLAINHATNHADQVVDVVANATTPANAANVADHAAAEAIFFAGGKLCGADLAPIKC